MKFTKRLVALMLSLVMVLGAVPCMNIMGYAEPDEPPTQHKVHYYMFHEYGYVTNTYYSDDSWNGAIIAEDQEVDLTKFTYNMTEGLMIDHIEAYNERTSENIDITDNKFTMIDDDVRLKYFVTSESGNLELFTYGYDEMAWSDVQMDDVIDSSLREDRPKIKYMGGSLSLPFSDEALYKYDLENDQFVTESTGFMTTYRNFDKGQLYYMTFNGSFDGFVFDSVTLNGEELDELDDYPYNVFEQGYYLDTEYDRFYVGIKDDSGKYTITLDANGGTSITDGFNTLDVLANFELPSNCTGMLPPEGKSFLGWSESPTGDILTGIQTISDNKTYYAIWGSATPTSSHTKKYKANDSDTAEKVSGSGKKNSTRTITPIEGKKVLNVTVLDKKGNTIEVTPNEDGTFEFIQPASDVTINVEYAKREVALNINSNEVVIDGISSTNDVKPIVKNGTTLLPLRIVAEGLGYQVNWNAFDPNVIELYRSNEETYNLYLNQYFDEYANQMMNYENFLTVENNRTFVEENALGELLGATISTSPENPNQIIVTEE